MEEKPRNERAAGGAIDLAEVRRKRMRDQARGERASHRALPDRFQTPEWLDRSFVLPLTKPERPQADSERPRAARVPTQSRPPHDDLAPGPVGSNRSTPSPAAAFRRPPAPEIDFSRVVRRSDQSRTLARAAVVSAGVSGLALVAYLLLGSSLALGVSLASALMTLVILAVRTRLATAPVPQRRP